MIITYKFLNPFTNEVIESTIKCNTKNYIDLLHSSITSTIVEKNKISFYLTLYHFSKKYVVMMMHIYNKNNYQQLPILCKIDYT